MAHRDFVPYQAVDLILRQVLRRVPPSGWAERVAMWWGTRYRGGPKVVRLRNGARMLVEPKDYLLLWLYYLGTFEPTCLGLLSKYLRPGGTMLDVGANIGLYSLTASKIVGPSGRVIAVEAVAPIAAALRANIERNRFTNITVVEAAAGDHEGTITLGLPDGVNSGGFSVGAGETSSTTYQARLMKLDDLIDQQGIERIDLVKMDIEGSECAALRGATRLLREFRPPFLMELNEPALERCGGSSAEIRRIMAEAGYQARLITEHGLVPLQEIGPQDCVECLFVHPDHRA